ncbi:hypothetical protein BLNAU_411 [Blattamonas nauphoetae]|uniref:Dymeclin n=1 Tax=Blattamonas nauphoetae TaxID=2049346 RepID=A0ABQ9YL60_9EUKA|nr:hypothetical protein BLNAU_411 [Blattamonas nauphoetae]
MHRVSSFHFKMVSRKWMPKEETSLLSSHIAQEIVYVIQFSSLLLDVLQPEIRFCMKHRVRHSSITLEQDPSKQLSFYYLSCQLRDYCLLAISALSLTENPLFDFLMSALHFVERIAICGGETEPRVDYYSTTETHLRTISTQQVTPSSPDKELALAAVYVMRHLSNGSSSQTRLLVSGNCIPPLRQIVTALPLLQHLYACPPVFPKVVQQTPLTKGQKPASTTTQERCISQELRACSDDLH